MAMPINIIDNAAPALCVACENSKRWHFEAGEESAMAIMSRGVMQ
jgi:hypothetical protein